MSKPTLCMLEGIPASGKSTLARHIDINEYAMCVVDKEVQNENIVIHSSDDLRQELFGDVNEQTKNNELFRELHRRIRRDLQRGKHVIYDATNINKKERCAFLRELNGIDCKKVCVMVFADVRQCIEMNQKRERKVPDFVIERQYKNFQPAHYSEGFDEIYITFTRPYDYDRAKYNLATLFGRIDSFDQQNKHHDSTLGGHCRLAYAYVNEKFPENTNLHIAALLHDIGKEFTQSKLNSRGVDDGDCHYYNHHCVSAYESAFYLCEMGLQIHDEVDIMSLIYYHMHPYMSWRSEKAMARDKERLGEDFFNDVMRLHEADENAH